MFVILPFYYRHSGAKQNHKAWLCDFVSNPESRIYKSTFAGCHPGALENSGAIAEYILREPGIQFEELEMLILKLSLIK